MHSVEFWTFFDQIARPKLGMRADTFAAMFSYLDRFNRPVGIVETVCTRKKDNWQGDGQSTLLFDKYAEHHPGSFVHTVDIDKDATATCSAMVSSRVSVHTGDSVVFLKSLDVSPIDLLYLDLFDLDMKYPLPSAIHHLKELVAIAPMISPETLVVVDDSPNGTHRHARWQGPIQITRAAYRGQGATDRRICRGDRRQAVFRRLPVRMAWSWSRALVTRIGIHSSHTLAPRLSVL